MHSSSKIFSTSLHAQLHALSLLLKTTKRKHKIPNPIKSKQPPPTHTRFCAGQLLLSHGACPGMWLIHPIILLEKSDFPLSRKYQLQTASVLWGTLSYSPSFMLGFCLAWTRVGFVTVSVIYRVTSIVLGSRCKAVVIAFRPTTAHHIALVIMWISPRKGQHLKSYWNDLGLGDFW